MIASTINALTGKARRQTRRDAAAAEAKRRWETMRAAVAEQADELVDSARPQVTRLRKQADVLADAAGDQLKDARRAAGPQAKQLRNKAVLMADPVTDRIREELDAASGDLGPYLAKLVLDVKNATRGEAERIIQTVHDSAEQARAEAEAESRRGRVWALLGWTMFGMAAGALAASEYAKRQQGEVAPTRIDQASGPAPMIPADTTAAPVLPSDAATTDPSGLPVRES